MAEMTYAVVEADDGSVIVTVAGELDISNVDALAGAVAPALKRSPAAVIVDVSDLGFADSSAIALWVRWASAVAKFELRHTSAVLYRVVESMGLIEVLGVTT
jgi:anti-anti-sigma factor